MQSNGQVKACIFYVSMYNLQSACKRKKSVHFCPSIRGNKSREKNKLCPPFTMKFFQWTPVVLTPPENFQFLLTGSGSFKNILH